MVKQQIFQKCDDLGWNDLLGSCLYGLLNISMKKKVVNGVSNHQVS